jgi:methylmalonyl-CoA/ethylmalonyl-CoA epimerase
MTPNVGLAKLGQISMNARDLPRATAFYRDTLRVPFLFEVPRMAFFNLAEVRLMLAVAETPEFDHPGSVLYFEVPDIVGAWTDLKTRGVAFEGPPHFIADLGAKELWMAFFKDTEGNTLALMSEVPKAA